MSGQLRELFASIIAVCNVTDPLKLWVDHKDRLCDDILYRARMEAGGRHVSLPLTSAMEMEALRRIDAYLHGMGRALSQFSTLPQPPDDDRSPDRLVHQQLALITPDVATRLQRNVPLLTDEQKAVFDAVDAALADPDPTHPHIFFIDGVAGSGKSFLLNLLLDHTRSKGHACIALAVASSGIASQLLLGGTTAHFRFKIPLHLTDDLQSCDIGKRSAEAKVCRVAKMVVWDEAPMLHAFAHSSVDRLLQDLCDSPTLYAGKVIVLSGDFRQLLPVIELGSMQDSVRACLKNYPRIWDRVRVMHLTKNMRLQRLGGRDAAEQQQFADWLLRVGNGTEPEYAAISPHAIRLLDSIVAPSENVDDLIARIFNDPSRFNDAHYLNERAIISPLNSDVSLINERVLNLFPGVARTYTSVDMLEKELTGNDQAWYTPEMLAMVDIAGLPPARLHIKIGMPVILLRNLNGDQGQVC